MGEGDDLCNLIFGFRHLYCRSVSGHCGDDYDALTDSPAGMIRDGIQRPGLKGVDLRGTKMSPVVTHDGLR